MNSGIAADAIGNFKTAERGHGVDILLITEPAKVDRVIITCSIDSPEAMLRQRVECNDFSQTNF